MPSVIYMGTYVNIHEQGRLQAAYRAYVSALLPTDVPCIHCLHYLTHGHGYYPRVVHFEEFCEPFCAHRRRCPICKRTFGLLPEIVSPFQRVAIDVQENVVKELASGMSYAKVADSIPSPLGPLSKRTFKRWFRRATTQISDIATKFSALVLSQQPDTGLPNVPTTVRDRQICFFYALGEKWKAAAECCTSATWNALRALLYLFAPSVSVNRVSYGLSSDLSP